MKINRYIFREYDIRGHVQNDFNPAVVELLGKGFGTYVKRQGGKVIALSGDVRLTTPRLIQNFKTGVLSTGINIVYIGILPTPANYFSMFHLDIDGAVQITGSHNPPEFNGFKLSLFRKAVFGKAIQSILTMIETDDFEVGNGNYEKTELLTDYSAMIVDKIKIERPMKVVMDCGNAAAAVVAPQIFQALGIDLKELYCDVDGTFPNHHPDPTVKENLNDLIELMHTDNYDVGVAFDGDADRVGVVDETGEIIWADQLMSLFLPEVIEPGGEILFDVKCSQALEESIIRLGGKPVMWKTGHSLIKQKMAELNCKFGGEMSGHLFFADDYFGYDDGIYVAARLVQLLSRSKKTLSDLRSELPVYYSTPEMRLACKSDEEKFRIAREAKSYFTKKYNCITIDGVRINFGDGWGLVRSSNTQPVIVCRFEANSPERMKEMKTLVLAKLRSFGELEVDNGY